MKRFFATVSAVALLGAPAASKPGQWTRIFDGRSLKGWTPKISGRAVGDNYLDTFQVRNGAIRVSYTRYNKGFDGRFGHLAFKRPLSAFRVRFDYRFYGSTLKGVENWQYSNSGIMLLGQDPASMTRDQKFPVSLEMQLLGAERPEPTPTGNLCTPGTNVVLHGKLETTHCITSSSPIIANGRWVHAEALVTPDGQVAHDIDGVPVMAYSAPQYD
ncbi:MAG: DUF1080 domain-containing protein, partial [Sphingomicrobium sp.]